MGYLRLVTYNLSVPIEDLLMEVFFKTKVNRLHSGLLGVELYVGLLVKVKGCT